MKVMFSLFLTFNKSNEKSKQKLNFCYLHMILGKNKSTKMTEIPEFMCRICEKQVNELTNITVPQNWILITKYLACANVTVSFYNGFHKKAF